MLDRFRGRVMFPIHNHLGKVVGFTGRILPQFDTSATAGPGGFVTAKYVNSPGDADLPKIKIALRILEEQRCHPRSQVRRARGRPDGFFDELSERRAAM